MKKYIVLAVPLFLATVGIAEIRDGCLPTDFCRLSADVNSPKVFAARVELEFRRLGGPRQSVLKALFNDEAHIRLLPWDNYVLTACQKGFVDCGGYVGAAAMRVQTGAPELRQLLNKDVVAIEEESTLQRMNVALRREFYERAIRNSSAIESGVRLYRAEAARRALREGFVDLVPLIRNEMVSWERSERYEVEPYLSVSSALGERNPGDALVELVRRDAMKAVASSKVADDAAPPFVASQEANGPTGVLALEELRRLAPVGQSEELKAILQLYEPVVLAYTKWAKQGPRRRSENPLAYLGVLGWRLAEAVGDLGDREAERKALGGRTLRDQVSEVEKELLKRGQIREAEMVSK